MKLPDVIQSAALSKVRAELKPISDGLSRLRATLDAFEALKEQDIERRISNSILVALGEPPSPELDPAFETAKVELRTALNLVADLVGLPAPPLRTEPEPPVPAPPALPAKTFGEILAESESPKVVAAQTPPPSKPIRRTTPEDIAWAKRVIGEVEALRPEVKSQHPTRLFHVLQALVAEVRCLLLRLPEDNYLHERLGLLVPAIGSFRVEGNVDEFVKGLAFHHTGDWERISQTHRRKVQDYDRDVARSERTPEATPPKSKKAAEPEPEKAANGYQWPALPRLRGLGKVVLLAGGIIIPEKLKSVHERFGLDVEWHEIDHDNPRASGTLMQRIRAGKVGAIVLLEGVMRHSTYKPVVEACNLAHVPYAMGDKAGVASLQQAFTELERQLGS